MSKKIFTILFTLSMILTTSTCGTKDSEVSVVAAEPEVIIQEVIKEVEVPVVSTVTTCISKEDIVIDTTSDSQYSFRSGVSLTGKYAVYFSQPRYFESKGGTVWTTDDSSIAIVDENGLVTALCSTDAERVLGIIAVSSLNHTEQPANYMPYMSDDSICFKGKTCAGFEEGVPTQVLYINPEAEGMFEYVTIPHEEIPDKVPSWFREVDHDREKWNLY